MKTATYRLGHHASGSIACVEFSLIDGEIKLDGISFLKGNVVDLDRYKYAKKFAKDYLTRGLLPTSSTF